MSLSAELGPPQLPLELQAAILCQCDQATLAAGCRVSLALLELAGPLLYESVNIRGPERLVELIDSSRSSAISPQLAPYLSLKLIRHLTYHVEPYNLLTPDCVPRFRSAFSAPARLLAALSPTTRTLPVDSLTVVHRQSSIDFENLPVQTLFHHLSPRRCCLECPTPHLRPRIDLSSTDRWDRLEEIAFVRTTPQEQLVEAPFLHPSRGSPVKVIYDHRRLPRGAAGVRVWDKVVLDLVCGRRLASWPNWAVSGVAAEKRMERIREVEVLVSTEEDRTKLLAALEGAKILQRTTIRVA